MGFKRVAFGLAMVGEAERLTKPAKRAKGQSPEQRDPRAAGGGPK